MPASHLRTQKRIKSNSIKSPVCYSKSIEDKKPESEVVIPAELLSRTSFPSNASRHSRSDSAKGVWTSKAYGTVSVLSCKRRFQY
jgi:hypothetical protein